MIIVKEVVTLQSDKIQIDGTKESFQKVMKEVEKTAEYGNLSKKESIQLDLLSEELMGMQKNMLHTDSGEFYIENDGKSYKIHLKTETKMDFLKQDEYKQIATSGKNQAYKGFMGKLSLIADTLFQNTVSGYTIYCSDMTPMANAIGMDLSALYDHAWVYSQELVKQEESEEKWDELEKSIVAKLADEIIIGSRNDYVEVVIYKNFDSK